MLVVRLFVGSALIISFDLACTGHTLYFFKKFGVYV